MNARHVVRRKLRRTHMWSPAQLAHPMHLSTRHIIHFTHLQSALAAAATCIPRTAVTLRVDVAPLSSCIDDRREIAPMVSAERACSADTRTEFLKYFVEVNGLNLVHYCHKLDSCVEVRQHALTSTDKAVANNTLPSPYMVLASENQ
jgi:hypothetical protein